MGFLSDLFGGKQKATTTTGPSATPEQQKLLRTMISAYEPQVGAGTPMPGFPMTAPFSPWQQALLATGQDVGQVFGTAGLGGDLWSNIQSTVGKGVTGGLGAQPITPEETEQYWTRAIYEPSKKMMKEDVMPAVKEAFAGPGYWGSARAEAAQRLKRDWEESMRGERAELEWETEAVNRAIAEAQAVRQLASSQQGLGVLGFPTQQAQQQLAGMGQLWGFAGEEQAQRQREINEQVSRFLAEQEITDPADVEIILRLLGLGGYAAVTRKTTGTATPSIASIIGGLDTGVGVASSIGEWLGNLGGSPGGPSEWDRLAS